MVLYTHYINLVKKEHYRSFRLSKQVSEAVNANLEKVVSAMLDYDVAVNKHFKLADVYVALSKLHESIPESENIIDEVREWMERAVEKYNEDGTSPIVPIGRMRTIMKKKIHGKIQLQAVAAMGGFVEGMIVVYLARLTQSAIDHERWTVILSDLEEVHE